ncbi:heavy-metal-associated domain-containing protein [Belliella kenyensis]|uniref:Heavy-metal-associated domain-containing protein n=1 Tax=Belliella kenyensis TaxID=1472724 RepID=A0ABV8EMU1_9BACT|nr:heavy-metal-associated domain-containing protein [Belliella kenyensis]MCH7400562.1 heavy-metal-associated domain-containing protein [Belliella kenyensis]MDN3602151.1 heavy-metal-associated domain-containing protein [Belliella kenyensis]
MLKRILLGTTLILVILVTTLAVHIYAVTRPKTGAISHLALTRIDFNQSLDSLQAGSLSELAESINGVQEVRVNKSSGHVICMYMHKEVSPKEIADKLHSATSMMASVYQPSEETLAQSCPAFSEESLTYRLGAFFQRSFENKTKTKL